MGVIFQPALPMRGVTSALRVGSLRCLRISTRTPHAGSDQHQPARTSWKCTFQPALPMRGVTRTLGAACDCELISTRTPHAGSDYGC